VYLSVGDKQRTIKSDTITTFAFQDIKTNTIKKNGQIGVQATKCINTEANNRYAVKPG
jgi:hypothetical protein